MDNQIYQDMIEYERIQLLVVSAENQIRLHFSFNPFLNYHFIERIEQERSLELKVISNPGTMICLPDEKFDYVSFFRELAQYVITRYEKFVFSI